MVNAKSLLKVLSLGIYCGHVIQVSTEDIDEEEAVLSITDLVQSNFWLSAG